MMMTMAILKGKWRYAWEILPRKWRRRKQQFCFSCNGVSFFHMLSKAEARRQEQLIRYVPVIIYIPTDSTQVYRLKKPTNLQIRILSFIPFGNDPLEADISHYVRRCMPGHSGPYWLEDHKARNYAILRDRRRRLRVHSHIVALLASAL